MARKTTSGRRNSGTRGLDQALIALFIGAMDANGHVAREELARAHHLIWSTKRFRRKSGESVGRLIERARTMLENQDAGEVIDAAAGLVPKTMRRAAFAIVADLLLADGRIDASEKRFLQRLAARFAIGTDAAQAIVDAMLVKNAL